MTRVLLTEGLKIRPQRGCALRSVDGSAAMPRPTRTAVRGRWTTIRPRQAADDTRTHAGPRVCVEARALKALLCSLARRGKSFHMLDREELVAGQPNDLKRRLGLVS